MIVNTQVDVAVIGAGPAGLAAALSAKQHGGQKVLVIDRNQWLGGILPQCIHDGFGVEELGVSLTGPEYAEKYIAAAEQHSIRFLTETMVLRARRNREIIAVNRDGIQRIKASALVLATGCREKTRWHAMIPGSRPSGIYTAGVAQAFINLYNLMPGRNIVIFGSGDVGLIMARRLTFEGANVSAVAEILPYASGLPRNIVQCLDDYGIPLYLNHTVTSITGNERVEYVCLQQVDEQMNPIPGTEKKIPCDTLLLSLGLIPENELARSVGVELDERTGGPVVNQQLETTIPGVFACGNCLQVYDTVDMLSVDAKKAGEYATKCIKHSFKKRSLRTQSPAIQVIAGSEVRYVIPQKIDQWGTIHLTLRAQRPRDTSTISVTCGTTELIKKRLRCVNPVNMIGIDVPLSEDTFALQENLEVTIRD